MFARHDLIWLTAQGWQRCRDDVGDKPGPAGQAALARWQQADWPAIVRRADVDMPDGEVCIGVALPPDPVSVSRCVCRFRPCVLPAFRSPSMPYWRGRLHAGA
jgi:hypothetical protein